MSERTKHGVHTEWLVLRCQDGDVVQESWVAMVRGLRALRDPLTAAQHVDKKGLTSPGRPLPGLDGL